MEFIYKAAPLGDVVYDIDEKNNLVKGYGSFFDNKDSDQDIIRKGAYNKTIKENGSRVKYLYQHDMMQPIGKMKAGVITENSVGIMPIVKENKGDYREIREVKLYEISAVTLAANDQAKILDVKGMSNIDQVYKRYDNICKLLRKGHISDEMGYALESEILKLKTYFINATQPVEETTEPVVKMVQEVDIYKYLINKL